jgi:putative GTP pyrophosphokinase
LPSLDFDAEKRAFQDYYNGNIRQLQGATESFLTLVRSIVAETEYAGSTVSGRIKDLSGAVEKFGLKYREKLELAQTPYEIKDHVTDLIGLRLVCLYEDQIEPIGDLFRQELKVLSITNKIATIEETENEFGYKGLHLDLSLDESRAKMRGFRAFAPYRFELQIRTIVQDSWSTLDHKIKYKKSIPGSLKRRINTLAALFELADREFRYIRDATQDEIERAENEDNTADAALELEVDVAAPENSEVEPGQYAPLDAFRFLRIARHFFPQYEFAPHRVDGFTAEVVSKEPTVSRGKFNYYLREFIAVTRMYRDHFLASGLGENFNPFTEMRHCLYAARPDVFSGMLTTEARGNFDAWLDGDGRELIAEARARKRPRRRAH